MAGSDPATDDGRAVAGAPTRLVALWHTNVVLVEVPADLPHDRTQAYVLGLVDTGEATFEAFEGGLFEDDRGDIPDWWLPGT